MRPCSTTWRRLPPDRYKGRNSPDRNNAAVPLGLRPAESRRQPATVRVNGGSRVSLDQWISPHVTALRWRGRR